MTEILLLIRDYSDKYDAKIDGQINDRMTAFVRFSQRKDLDYYRARHPGPFGRRRQWLHPLHRSECVHGIHLDGDAVFVLGSALRV